MIQVCVRDICRWLAVQEDVTKIDSSVKLMRVTRWTLLSYMFRIDSIVHVKASQIWLQLAQVHKYSRFHQRPAN
jgi:hypothetical protein